MALPSQEEANADFFHRSKAEWNEMGGHPMLRDSSSGNSYEHPQEIAPDKSKDTEGAEHVVDHQEASPPTYLPQAERLIQIADRAQLFHTPDGAAYADIVVNGHVETWPVKSGSFRRWLYQEYYKATQRAPNSEALQNCLNVIDARAQFDSPLREVFLRVAMNGGNIYVDLVDEDWRVVDVDRQGWRVVQGAPVKFRRTKGMCALRTPQPGGTLNRLRKYLNVSCDEDFMLVVAFILAALRQGGPYPVLAVSGEQGSAKSTLAAVVRRLIDPAKPSLRSLPRDDRDLFVAANNAHVVAFDNLSGIPNWLSDSLCRLSTGGGFGVRKNWTDDEEMLFDATRPVILNGIEDVIARPDLADRSILLSLPAISDERRRPEEEFWAEFEQDLPLILGALLDALVHGLRTVETVKLEKLPRMADFARWAVACEGQFCDQAVFLASYEENRATAVRDVLDSDLIGTAIQQLARDSEWKGTATQLLDALTGNLTEVQRRSRGCPASAKALSGHLRRLAPGLRKVGINVDFRRKSGGSRTRLICITAIAADSAGDSASRASHASDISSGNGTTSCEIIRDGRDGGDVPISDLSQEACRHCDGEGCNWCGDSGASDTPGPRRGPVLPKQ